MTALLHKAQSIGMKILNNVEVLDFVETDVGVSINSTLGGIKTNKILFATNGFSQYLLNESFKPARAQVLITKPIKNLHVKGTFHLDKGYYYFRNIDNRILFGGGRNLNFLEEETTEFNLSKLIQDKLDELLTTVILPDTDFEIESRWCGTMGVGNQKKTIVKQLSNHVFCGVRLGRIGIAIGSLVGKELSDLV